jgi:DDE superfamily endonuclease
VKKNDRTLWQGKTWCIPPQANADCVYHMEDVLRVYQLPDACPDPVVGMDEASKPLIGEVNAPWPLRSGRVTCEDYAYERKGVCHQFMCCEPLRGWRHVRGTVRRTKRDWAAGIRALVDVHYPQATRMRLVLDNLNTHPGASLYEAFPPDEARRFLDRLAFHPPPSTPVGSTWRKSNAASCRVNASIADWRTLIGYAARSAHGKNGGTNHRSKSIGVFPSPSPGINSKNSIRSLKTAIHPGEKEPVNRRLSSY